jgi:GNAT superfamily N-acetyltransferase
MASLHVPQQVAPANRRLAQLCRAVRPTGCVAAASSQESTRVMRSPVEGTRIELIPQRPAGAKQAAGAANVRVTLVDEATGTHLSWATVIDQQLRFGGSSFLCGGIGGVATPEEHRRKGYSTVVMRAAVQFMRSEGYPMTYLFGINNYYEGTTIYTPQLCL